MTNESMNEQALVEQFASVKEKLDSLKEQCSLAQKEFDTIETALVELLQTEEKEATAKYERLGWCVLSKPRVFANCKEENKPLLFKYLRDHKRGDLIKPTVNPVSLSTYVSELLAEAKQIPDFVGYYLKTSVRYYKGG